MLAAVPYGAVTGGDAQAVNLLAAVQQLVSLPGSEHETVAAVARLLGRDAKLLTYRHVDDALEPVRSDSVGFGCGCRIELADGEGVMWAFHREDGAWCLVRQADGHMVELAATGPCADPRHLTALIHRVLEDTP